MSAWILISLFAAIMLLSAYLTYQLRQQAISRHWLDVPTDRSSHHQPIPAIGGAAIALVVTVCVVLIAVLGFFDWLKASVWLVIIAGLAGVGFIDDLRGLSVRLRMLVHLLIALLIVWQFGGVQSLDLGVIELSLGPIAWLVGMIWVIGFVNMFNFMDGINGIAGFQALISALFLGLWLALLGANAESLLFLSVAAAATGFLYWNFSPAKVFMGDAGSTMLGAIFAAISLQLHNQFSFSIMIPAMLFSWFLADTSITFSKRLLRGEKVWQAHRQHFYQQLAKTPADHTKVTGIISLLTLIISAIVTALVF